MKKLIVLLALVSTTAFAGGGHGGHHYGGSNIWAPLIIGGVIGYGMSQNQRQPEPVIIQQAPQPVYINTPKVYNMESPPPYRGATPLYQQRSQWEPSCNCYVVVYAQIGWQ
jgi:hypothetical protein